MRFWANEAEGGGFSEDIVNAHVFLFAALTIYHPLKSGDNIPVDLDAEKEQPYTVIFFHTI